jgi:hypothetical protein
MNKKSVLSIGNIINEDDKKIVLSMAAIEFSEYSSYDDVIEYCSHVTDFEKSIIAKIKNEIVGFILLSENNLSNFTEGYILKFNHNLNYDLIEKTKSLKGVEAVALIVKDGFRNGAVIYNLINTLNKMTQYDYTWFQQFSGLSKNVNYAKKYETVGSFFEDELRINIYLKFINNQ